MWFQAKKAKLLRIPLENQLHELMQIGVILKDSNFVHLLAPDQKELFEKGPYIHLLLALGTVLPNTQEPGEYLSDQIWSVGYPRINKSGDLLRNMKRIADIIRTDLLINHISEELDLVQHKGWLSFTASGQAYRCELDMGHNGMMITLLLYISRILACSGSSKRFYFASVDDSWLFVYMDKHHFPRLNGLLNVFIPVLRDE
ncbi:hypothetical protein B5M42_018175 [Paenibacillus athensensis]|uniref:Uncharacterized protein n=1 Tax=Paenibacillus athensensis TaxID=1967502 RepID=A0A4Y8Q2E8_9BACL|nr:hypothetical protein [Paenibacillus athensensis]MCD1260732.1 hypothetical protein [Paenibacillus athensensis]